MMRQLRFLPLLLLLTACTGDKFPYPPQFVQVEDVCPCTLGAPPETGSAEYKKEIAYILAIQAKMTASEKAKVMGEDKIIPEMIVTPVLGATYSAETHPRLFGLLRRAASDAWRIGDSTQEFWGRQRPWLVDKRVQLLVKPITRPSYPSGHSNTNHVWAHVLSELFPQKQEALFARAYAIGSHRMHGGVHFPSDVKAGKRLAAMIYEVMKANPEFQAELDAARAELKAPVSAANDNTPLHSGEIGECPLSGLNPC
jgi:acid phosphatase (class A)